MNDIEYALRARSFLAGAIIGLAVLAAPNAVFAQVAVTVTPAQLAAVTAACATAGPACTTAIQNLAATLAAANPGVPQATVIGSIASAVSASFNGGTVPAAIAANVLSSTATVATNAGLTTVANSIQTAVASVNAGQAVNLQAIAEGTASPS